MVGADLAAVQLRLHLALQHPQMLRIVCDHLNEYSRVQKRLLVPVRKRQHCRHCPHTRFAGQKNNLYNGKG